MIIYVSNPPFIRLTYCIAQVKRKIFAARAAPAPTRSLARATRGSKYCKLLCHKHLQSK